MGQTLLDIKRRIIIAFPMMVLFGVFIFLKDRRVGSLVLGGIGVGLIFCLILYYKIKKAGVNANNVSSSIEKKVSYSLTIVGILLIIIAISLFILEKNISKDVFSNFGLGLIFLIVGIYHLKNKQIYETKWRDIPLGFKIIIIYLTISFALNFLNLYSTLKQPIVLFGIIIHFPFSILLHIFSLSIPLIIFLLIFSKKGWKWILGLESFNIICIISTIAWFFLTPLTKILDVMNQTLPDISAESLQSIEFSLKLRGLIPVFIGLILGLVILFYVYKKKEYFSNDK